MTNNQNSEFELAVQCCESLARIATAMEQHNAQLANIEDRLNELTRAVFQVANSIPIE